MNVKLMGGMEEAMVNTARTMKEVDVAKLIFPKSGINLHLVRKNSADGRRLNDLAGASLGFECTVDGEVFFVSRKK